MSFSCFFILYLFELWLILRKNRKKHAGGFKMTKSATTKNRQFQPNHIGTQPRGYGGNKGRKMQDQSGEHPQVIQTKGE